MVLYEGFNQMNMSFNLAVMKILFSYLIHHRWWISQMMFKHEHRPTLKKSFYAYSTISFNAYLSARNNYIWACRALYWMCRIATLHWIFLFFFFYRNADWKSYVRQSWGLWLIRVACHWVGMWNKHTNLYYCDIYVDIEIKLSFKISLLDVGWS